MKIRIDGETGTWSVFMENKDGSGVYRKIDPVEFSSIEIDTNPLKKGACVTFFKPTERPLEQ